MIVYELVEDPESNRNDKIPESQSGCAGEEYCYNNSQRVIKKAGERVHMIFDKIYRHTASTFFLNSRHPGCAPFVLV
jgi:hypothetical protein